MIDGYAQTGKPRVLIVGGVAGGASCAARCRRNSEDAEIVMFDKGPYVSFANCGLPYYVGGVIKEEKKLLVADAALFKRHFNIEVRVESEVISIDRAAKCITVRNAGKEYVEHYDKLLLAPGAKPIRPPLPGIDLPGIYSLRTIPDSRQIRSWIDGHKVKHAVVVGAGFVGLEVAENLVERGIEVTILEGGKQVMAPLDAEMVWPLHQRMIDRGVKVVTGAMVQGFAKAGGADRLSVDCKGADPIETDMVILGIGVRPEVELCKAAGIALGARGGIETDDHMRTNDEDIYAVGDAVEVTDYVTKERIMLPMAGPANRQGRIAADNIMGKSAVFRGVQGTAVCGAFGMVVACTGASEKTLRRLGRTDFCKVYLHPGQHVGYYPNARPIDLKVLYSKEDGSIFGAQAVGEDGVEKRIDVISMAIQSGLKVYDLEESELCYSPQFGAAKDPTNMAGMICSNALRGDAPLKHWTDLAEAGGPGAGQILLDVREPDEFAAEHVPGAINVPLSQLRQRMGELPRDKDVLVYCVVGQRGYYAVRALRINGVQAYNVAGGITTYRAVAKVTTL